LPWGEHEALANKLASQRHERPKWVHLSFDTRCYLNDRFSTSVPRTGQAENHPSFAVQPHLTQIPLSFPPQIPYMRRNIAKTRMFCTGLCWTTSRLKASRFLHSRKEKHDVDHC
jgi:hypothetical protein